MTPTIEIHFRDDLPLRVRTDLLTLHTLLAVRADGSGVSFRRDLAFSIVLDRGAQRARRQAVLIRFSAMERQQGRLEGASG